MARNPWKHVRVDPARIACNPYVNPPPPPAPGTLPGTPAGGTAGGAPTSTPPASGTGSTAFSGSYILMDQTSTYALGLKELRAACQCEGNTTHPHSIADDGSRIYRPLTFKQNIEARVKEYNTATNADGSLRTEEQKLYLCTRWLDSCMGIAYRKKSTKFTLIPQCEQLISIPDSCRDTFLSVPYRSMREMELNSTQRGVVYNGLLTQDQVINHPAWKAAVEDEALLREYAGIIFPLLQTKYNRDKGMGFFVVQNPYEDQLRALFVHYLNINSNAIKTECQSSCPPPVTKRTKNTGGMLASLGALAVFSTRNF